MKTIDDEIKTRFQNDKHRFLANVVFTSNWFQNKWTSFLKPFGISIQQMNVLRILKGAGDWKTMNDIKALMIDKTPNATRLSDKLLSKGYVERKRSSKDRRVVYLNITKAGLKLLDDIEAADNTGSDLILDKITEEEAKAFSHILDKMRG